MDKTRAMLGKGATTIAPTLAAPQPFTRAATKSYATTPPPTHPARRNTGSTLLRQNCGAVLRNQFVFQRNASTTDALNAIISVIQNQRVEQCSVDVWNPTAVNASAAEGCFDNDTIGYQDVPSGRWSCQNPEYSNSVFPSSKPTTQTPRTYRRGNNANRRRPAIASATLMTEAR